jgi:hypothetical protein
VIRRADDSDFDAGPVHADESFDCGSVAAARNA